MISLDFYKKWLTKEKPKPTGAIALEMGQTGLAISRIVYSGEQITCPLCQFTHGVSKDDFANGLKAVVEQYGLAQSDCHWVLHGNDYRVLLIDKPQVPESEYAAAAQWLIQDMIDFSPESAVLDTFQPASGLPGQDNKLYVVVAQREYLASFKSLIDEAGLNAVSITIREMALRNVLQLFDGPIALLQLDDSRSSLMVVDRGMITMMRTINIGLRQVDSGQADAARIHEEIERSLKYYGQQLRQAAPQATYVSPLPAEYAELSTALQGLNLPTLDLRQKIQFADSVTDTEISHAFASLGAAVMQETVDVS